MTYHRIVLLRVVAAALTLALPAMHASAKPKPAAERKARAEAPVDPALAAMLGSAVPADRVHKLSSVLRTSSMPGAASGSTADLPVFTVLQDAGSPGSPRYEVSGIVLEIVIPLQPRLRLERASLALMPAADGRSCRFEMNGSPFGGTSNVKASGTIEWAAGPFGGDRLDVVFGLDDAPVERLRALFPTRFDPSVRGMLEIHGKASGVVAETTTEEVPATPLKGDLVLTADWQVLGRTAPATLTTSFSLDDKSMRLVSGRLAWEGFEPEITGWFSPDPGGGFDLTARFKNIDTYKVATDWNVPVQWRPVSTVSGELTLKGSPGEGRLRFDARAPTMEVAGLGGYAIQIQAPKFRGNMLDINAEFATSVRGDSVRVGQFELGALPVGLSWWRGAFSANSQNTSLWGGENDAVLTYRPELHPSWVLSGKLVKATAPELVKGVAPWLGLDVEGSSSAVYTLGQDDAGVPYLSAHASLLAGRIGNVDLFARLMDALSAADPALAISDVATLLPQPRRGSGTRVDRLFFETAQVADGYDVGRMMLKGGDFQLDADGRCGRDGSLRLEGSMTIPDPVAAKLLASAPWLSRLTFEGGRLFVPIVIAGTTAAPTVALDQDYGRLLANARAGQPVTAPGVKQTRSVGVENLSTIPGDPKQLEY